MSIEFVKIRPAGDLRPTAIPRPPEAVLRRMVRGVSTRDYADVIDLRRVGFGVEKSSVSRDFVRASAAQVKALADRRFDGMHFPVFMIDGVESSRYSGRERLRISQTRSQLQCRARAARLGRLPGGGRCSQRLGLVHSDPPRLAEGHRVASCREIQFLEAAWLMAPRAAGACVSQKKLQGLPFGAGDNRKREPRFEQTGTGTGASGSCEWE